MKRTYSDMDSALSILPKLTSDDPRLFKSSLNGSYRLRVTKVTDISKPTAQPCEDLDEPDEQDIARSNARMIQMELKDADNVELKAVETEFIELLTNVKQNCVISITGPVDIRCGNFMLAKRHVVNVEEGPKEDDSTQIYTPPIHAQASGSTPTQKAPPNPIPVVELDEDWDEEDENDCIILDD